MLVPNCFDIPLVSQGLYISQKTFLHTVTHCNTVKVMKGNEKLVCSLCWYECPIFELETAHKEVTIAALIQNTSLGRQKVINRECFYIA